jgi:hypothetical protein
MVAWTQISIAGLADRSEGLYRYGRTRIDSDQPLTFRPSSPSALAESVRNHVRGMLRDLDALNCLSLTMTRTMNRRVEWVREFRVSRLDLTEGRQERHPSPFPALFSSGALSM